VYRNRAADVSSTRAILDIFADVDDCPSPDRFYRNCFQSANSSGADYHCRVKRSPILAADNQISEASEETISQRAISQRAPGEKYRIYQRPIVRWSPEMTSAGISIACSNISLARSHRLSFIVRCSEKYRRRSRPFQRHFNVRRAFRPYAHWIEKRKL
jgi:hypothetical protein